MEETPSLNSDWAISLYRKVGRVYAHVGDFWSGNEEPEFAYELFAGFVGWTPPHVAIEQEARMDISEDSELVEYEIRLYSKNRVLASVLWPNPIVADCIEDYRSRKLTKFVVTAEIEVDETDGDDPAEWDLAELAENGQIKILDSAQMIVLPSSNNSKGEENAQMG